MSKRMLATGVLLVVTACSSAPQQQHEYSLMLDALPTSGNTDVPKTETLNIRRVDLPAFLQTRALVMQVTENEIVSARHHSWTDRLDDSIARVLELALVDGRPQLLIVDVTDVVCQLDIRFDRFHAAAEGEVLVSGRFSLDADGIVTSQSFDVSRALPVGGYANAVVELRKSLNDLASEIGEAIEAAGGCVVKEPVSDDNETDPQSQ
jgi:uncharacterized lipoprotein YmbA